MYSNRTKLSRSLQVALALTAISFTQACGKGGFNFNEMFVSKAQQNAIDELMQEAQYEYDKGRYDEALSLTNRALEISPNSADPAVLKGYVFLSKAGLDAINLSKKLIVSNEESKKAPGATDPTAPKKSGDTTTDNFNVLKKILNLSESDYEQMGDATTLNDRVLYFPKSASVARAGTSATLSYLNDAVSTLCPLVPASSNPEDDRDTRHDCTKNPFFPQATGRGNFAWALAHLGEAISFYSVVLYDLDGDGIPSLQQAVPTDPITSLNAGSYINALNAVNNGINAIFPSDPEAAADSMLNALFSDLKTTSTALAAIPGIPAEISDSVQKSVTDLQTKIDQITASTTQTDPITAQNEALKGSLTKGASEQLSKKIDSPEFDNLSLSEKPKACCVYLNMNPTAAKPNNCAEIDYTAQRCAQILSQ